MAAPSSDVPEGAIPDSTLMDPLKADVIQHKAKRRRLRKQREPWPEMVAAKPAMEKRTRARQTHPMVMLEPAGMDAEHMVPLHNDERLHDLQLCDAFGTRSYAVMWTFMRQLEELCSEKWWDPEAQQWRLNEATFNTVLALVSSIRPKNEMEAALAAQMAAVHMLTMKVSARAIRYDYDTKSAAVVGKLARTFTMQMQELRAMRGKSRTTRQSIKVTKELHQHVHYHDARGAAGNGGQSHAARDGGAAPTAQRPALPGPDALGEVVPLPRRSRAG